MILGAWATHRNTSAHLIERLAVPGWQLPGRLRALLDIPGVTESFVLSTCNRVEFYVVAQTDQATPPIAASILKILTDSPPSPGDGGESVVVATGAEVVRRVLAIACGLDSMVIGECQIVAQIRHALRAAEDAGTIGPVLGNLVRTALRTSKRARTTTAIGGTGRSMVSVGLELAAAGLGDLTLRSGLLIGAGKMGTLAGLLLRDAGMDAIVVANRTRSHASQLAEKVSGTEIDLSGLADAISAADVIISTTDAPGHVVTVEQVATAMRRRPDDPLFILDLALPRDIEPQVRYIPNVTLVDIGDIGRYLRKRGAPDDVATAWSIVDESVDEFHRWRERRQVAHVVSALRAVASQLVDSEVRRLHSRLPQLDSRSQKEIDAAVRRAVGKLPHTATIRVKALATGPEGSRCIDALTVLFDLESPKNHVVPMH